MAMMRAETSRLSAIDKDGLQRLLDALAGRGYRLIGPRVRDQAIVYDDIAVVGDLPKGWTDEQDGGRYRLVRREDDALFGYAVGPHSWKQFLHPPIEKLWRAEKAGDEARIIEEPEPSERYAFIGVRACELKAIEVQDRVFTGGAYVDRNYQARRDAAFIVALNCSKAGGTCFCVSMKAGPRVEGAFDLALTEITDEGAARYVVEAGSQRGREILGEISAREATPEEAAAAEKVVAKTAASMGRRMPADGLRDVLMNNLDHPRWDNVAERCLSCGNCTMACPTCFCTTVSDASDLAGVESERVKRWDSCFTMDHSYMHGGSVRASAKSRYRQWMTHKLATWIDQFGMSGCVGCGRCITWCPVGIDITAEAAAIRGGEEE